SPPLVEEIRRFLNHERRLVQSALLDGVERVPALTRAADRILLALVEAAMERLLQRVEQTCATQHGLVPLLNREKLAVELEVQIVPAAQVAQNGHLRRAHHKVFVEAASRIGPARRGRIYARQAVLDLVLLHYPYPADLLELLQRDQLDVPHLRRS